MVMFTLAFAIIIYGTSAWEQSLPPPCDSNIYCYGELLHTVQTAQIFNDSKTFVDKKLNNSPEKTLRNFENLLDETLRKPNRRQIVKFVNENFADGKELDKWTPTDFQENPSFLQAIKNKTVQEFAKNLIKLWPTLAVKVKAEVNENSDRYSLIAVPNGFVIPGGRFREFYYWDSYWIIEGLLISEMLETARGMIENFMFIVEKYGFMPNGGRIYYLNRSQPPLLTAMAYRYYHATTNVPWLRKHIDTLDKELRFWLEKRTVDVNVSCHHVKLARYWVPNSGPRPESYREDYDTAAGNEQIYVDLKSGAESGWDYSTRWFVDENGGNRANLSQISTSRFLPVDLNAYLCGAFRDIARLYNVLGNDTRRYYWLKKYREWKKAVAITFWNSQDGTWYDLDLQTLNPRRHFYVSNLAPLWTQCYDSNLKTDLADRTVSYFKREKLMNYMGGIPTSLEKSGQQWDFPNAWPPLQDIAVQGLRLTEQRNAMNLARELAFRWVDANIVGFTQSGEMFEKYDAVTVGQYGGGGEYVVQSGFGWSNGVALKFINEFYR